MILYLIIKLLLIFSIFAHAKENSITYWKHRISHTWEFLHLISLFLAFGLIWIGDVHIISLIAYIPLRMALFSPIYGVLIKQGYQFLGTTLWYDRWLQKLVDLENKKNIPIIKGIPLYTIYIGICFTIGFFFEALFVYLIYI